MRFLHWLAWVRANEGAVEVLNLAFWNSAHFFACWSEYPACLFPMRASFADHVARTLDLLPDRVRRWLVHNALIERSAHRLGSLLPHSRAIANDDRGGAEIRLDGPEFLQSLSGVRLITCSGWCIAGWQNLAQHQHALRGWFRPAPRWKRAAEEYMRGLRGRYDLAVGVLIRQSDYSIWNGGRFHFPTSQYANWMKQILDLYTGRKVVFVIASEAWQDPRELQGLPYVFAPGAHNLGGHPFDSFTALSLCDVIASPPSTFSATAAFVGDIPLWPLGELRQELKLGDLLPDALVQAAQHPTFRESVK